MAPAVSLARSATPKPLLGCSDDPHPRWSMATVRYPGGRAARTGSQVREEPPQQCKKTTARFPWPLSLTCRRMPLDVLFISVDLKLRANGSVADGEALA